MERHESLRFIELQIRFAQRLVELTSEPWAEILEKHTVFRQILGMPYGDAIKAQPLWQEFVSGIAQQPDRAQWAYEFHLRHLPRPGKSDELRFGCFSYDYYFQPVVRLHFGNPTNESVLGRESVALRRAELTSLFRHIRQKHPDAERVRGSSWLYNIEAYRRLFPPAYVNTARPAGYETGYFSLWGQFLKANRSVREDAAEEFLSCLKMQASFDGCLQCFPYQVLRPECSVNEFYQFYDLS